MDCPYVSPVHSTRETRTVRGTELGKICNKYRTIRKPYALSNQSYSTMNHHYGPVKSDRTHDDVGKNGRSDRPRHPYRICPYLKNPFPTISRKNNAGAVMGKPQTQSRSKLNRGKCVLPGSTG